MKKGNKGFTLIELLVVIAIIAILSTVVMAGLNSARSKARDAKRLSDIKQIQAALELCFDNGLGYPGVAGVANGAPNQVIGTAGLVGSIDCSATAGAVPFSTYMAVLPNNPLPGGTNYMYCSTANAAANCTNGTTQHASYRMTFTLENASGSLASGLRTATPAGIL